MEVEEEREMKEKREETHSEIDLRLHLHRPRLTRITHDIHNVRAGEDTQRERERGACVLLCYI